MGMTIADFKTIIKKYNIPEDVTMLSDSGWECGETIWYNEEEKEIIFTQAGNEYDHWFGIPGCTLLRSCKEDEE